MPKNVERPPENESALKNLFNLPMLKRVATSISKTHASFDQKSFLKLMPKLEPLEMKPRVRMIREELRTHLPQDYLKALQILVASAELGHISGFDLWPYTDFIQTYGLDETTLSLEALKTLTPRFTSEWAVRPFLIQHPTATLKFMLACARSKNVDVRRWASEGTRPRLPWGERLQDFVRDPSPTRPILEALKFDPELYVRKSVANHLNDIAKDHPDLVVEILTEWKKEARGDDANTNRIEWIIRRSLRTLIKNGHPEALGLIGVNAKPKIEMTDFKVKQKKIKLGERVEFEFGVKSMSKQPQKLVVDYLIHFVKSNKKTSPKVFKLNIDSSGRRACADLEGARD